MYHVLAVETVFESTTQSPMQTDAAPHSLTLIKSYAVIVRPVFGIQISARNRRCENPVPEHGSAKLNGFKKVWKLQSVHIFSRGYALPALLSRVFGLTIVAFIKNKVKTYGQAAVNFDTCRGVSVFVVLYNLFIGEFIA